MRKVFSFIVLSLSIFSISILLQCDNKSKRHNNGFCSIGTEELNTAMSHWKYYFKKENVNSTIDGFLHEGRGTLVAVDALYKKICDLATMSRPMNSQEIDRFITLYKKRPIAIPVAIEALAIVTHSKTPVKKITLNEVEILFGKTPEFYSEVFSRMQSNFKNSSVSSCGINSATDRYQWFRQDFLNGNYGDRVLEMGSTSKLSKAVSQGECEFTYLRPNEILPKNSKILQVQSLADKKSYFMPTLKNIQSGRYALTRYYYIYLPPKNHETKVNAMVAQDSIKFVQFILGSKAQSILKPLGLYPVNEASKNKALKILKEYR